MSESIDCSGFVGVLRDLQQLSGKGFFPILVDQVGAILRNCIRHTPARSVPALAARVSRYATYIEFSDGTIITRFKKASVLAERGDEPDMFLAPSTYPLYAKRWPKKSKVPTLRNGMSWHNMRNRFRAELWGSFVTHEAGREEELQRILGRKKAARGLAKKSWWQCAEDLGLNPGLAADYVRKAHRIGPNGAITEYKEGFAEKIVERAAAVVEIRVTNPLLTGKLDGEAILRGAIAARELAFQRELETGVFQDLKTRAQRYPGIFT